MAKNYKYILSIAFETVLSTAVCAVGVCLFVEAGIGSDTIDVLVDGIHKTFSITLGQGDQIFSIIFLILAFLLNRRYIGVPSIAYTLMIGFMIDAVNLFILPLHLSASSLWIRFACVLLGQLCFAISYGLFQTVEKGMNTVDAVIYFFSSHLHISYVWMRTGFDISFFLLGYALGGVIGIGTVISVLTTGVLTHKVHEIIVSWKKKMGWSITDTKEKGVL